MLQNELHFIIEKFGKFFVFSKNKTNQKKKNPPKKKKRYHTAVIFVITISAIRFLKTLNLRIEKRILQSALS